MMTGLGSVERLPRNDLRHNRTRKRPGLIQLGDACLRDVFLLIIAVEDHRPVLAAGVWPLTIQLRRVVGNREKHFEKLSVGNVRRVEGNLYEFGVPGVSRADDFVFSRGRRTAGVTGSGTLDALTCWKTAWIPRKQPSAITAVSFPDRGATGESTTGLGRTRLPSAASTWFCANIAPKSRVAIAAIVTLLHLRVFPTGCMVRTSPKQFGFLSVPKVTRARDARKFAFRFRHPACRSKSIVEAQSPGRIHRAWRLTPLFWSGRKTPSLRSGQPQSATTRRPR